MYTKYSKLSTFHAWCILFAFDISVYTIKQFADDHFLVIQVSGIVLPTQQLVL